jgi:hypothetical protein
VQRRRLPRCACGTRPRWWRQCSGGHRGPEPASAGWLESKVKDEGGWASSQASSKIEL